MTDISITDSRFYMWRTLFALVHADGIITQEETRFMSEALEDVPFSDEQARILMLDARVPQGPVEMFEHVTSTKDQATFFALARTLCHIDGDYGEDEQKIMLQLQQVHVQKKNVDELIGQITLSFEDDSQVSWGGDAEPDKALVGKFYNFFGK